MPNLGRHLPLGFGEVFTYVNPTTQAVLHFDIQAMWAAVFVDDAPSRDVECLKIIMQPEHVEQVRTNADIEYAAASVTDEDLRLPILCVQFEDDTAMIVDGNHRMLAHALRGHETYPAFRYKARTWQKFLLDLPPTLSATLAADVAPALHWEVPSVTRDTARTACGHDITITFLATHFTQDHARISCSGCRQYLNGRQERHV